MSQGDLILSIDTADRALGVDLSADGASLSRRVVDEPRVHASLLVPTILDLLDASGRSFNDVAAVAVSKGPGSYTGLRIGSSAAKGLTYSLSIPLIGIPTMEAMAVTYASTGLEATLVTCLSSRRNEVYAQVWEIGASVRALSGVASIALADAEKFLSDTGKRRFVAAGSGSVDLARATSNSQMVSMAADSAPNPLPIVHGVAALAAKRFAEGRFDDVADFEPAYLRDFVAKTGGSPFSAVRNR